MKTRYRRMIQQYLAVDLAADAQRLRGQRDRINYLVLTRDYKCRVGIWQNDDGNMLRL